MHSASVAERDVSLQNKYRKVKLLNHTHFDNIMILLFLLLFVIQLTFMFRIVSAFNAFDLPQDLHTDPVSHFSLFLGNCCKSCITRIPFATLMATMMLLIGVGVFCGTMYRGASLSVIMFDHVFHLKLLWIEAIQIIFVVIAASMAALGFMILFVGFLATGATRHKVYRAWGSRVGGRISCAVFMVITYTLKIVWIVILCFLSIVTFMFTIFWKMCSKTEVRTHRTCIDLTQFSESLEHRIFASFSNQISAFSDFLFPIETREEDMRICEEFKVKAFCKDSVEKAEVMFILATLSCLLIILSLVHYLMCLAANYAHIRDHEKFQELQELQNLTEMEYSAASKDRF